MRQTIAAALTAVLFLASCTDSNNPRVGEAEPGFRITVEEAGFVAKGELFRIYGETADPVIVDVAATKTEFDGQPAWQLDTLVDVSIEGRREQVRWRFWVGLDDDGSPTVIHAEEQAVTRGDPETSSGG